MITDSFDWPQRMAAATARRDAALVRRYGRLEPPAEASADLLRALSECWPLAQFDELNIAGEAPASLRLARALAVIIGPLRLDRRRAQLDAGNQLSIERWLISVVGQELDGLALRRDLIGWCTVETADGWRQ